MTVGASTVWRIRVAGNDANGAGYDATIGGAGTDYSQQDSPQLSLTDIACSNTTTVTSATGGFTSAMIGNAIRITGGGATSGYYFITARTDTNTITVDRTPGTVTNGTGKVGGAAATCQRMLNSSNATGDKVVAGNIVYIRGAGTDTPSSADYTTSSGHITPVSGTSTAWVKVIGENGRPRLHNNGLLFHASTYLWCENLYVYVTDATNVSYGIINTNTDAHFLNLVVNTNAAAAAVGLNTGSRGSVIGCEILSGTLSPASSTGSGIACGYGQVFNNTVHHMRNDGISDSGLADISFNKIYNCVGNGISASGSTVPGAIKNNTINANSGHGINIATQITILSEVITNNIISNNGGSGLRIAAGTAATNDLLKRYADYNCFYNNTSGNYSAISSGANDTQGVDPQYTDPTTSFNFSLGTNLKALGRPLYLDPGAVQRQEPAGGGGGLLINPGLSGGLR